MGDVSRKGLECCLARPGLEASYILSDCLCVAGEVRKIGISPIMMASPFNIISNPPAPQVPPPGVHPRPEWLRVKFFGGER